MRRKRHGGGEEGLQGLEVCYREARKASQPYGQFI